ncbi:MAG: DUF58 domain-containing protein [bacterium]
MKDYRRFLKPEVISRLSGLQIKARLVVEGFIAGLHKSPFRGFNVEFAEYRPYVPGDEIRYIDWKAYAKSDKFYIKEFEEETNLKAYLLLDASASMGYSSGKVSKLEYGSYLAASLTYLMLKQQDYVGLITFDEGIRHYIPPRGHPAHLHAVLEGLESLTPRGETGISRTLHELAERIKRRGLFVIISDLFDDQAAVMAGLSHLRHKKHEVLLFHLLDNYELTFPFDGSLLFKDMEDGTELPIEADYLREEYLSHVKGFIDQMQQACGQAAIDYVCFDTSTPLDYGLSSYLTKRMRR